MSYIFEGDSEDAKRNRCSVIGGSGIADNYPVARSIFTNESTTEPITTADAKAWLRVDISDDDTLIGTLIKAARIACERYANQSFINRTVTSKVHNGLGGINLPYGPVIAITSIKDGDTVVSNYDISTPYGNDLTIIYTAGYDTLPEDVIVAIKNQVAFMYENRGDESKLSGMSELSKMILNPIRNV